LPISNIAMPAGAHTKDQIESRAKILAEAESEEKLTAAKQYFLDGLAASMAAAAKHHGVNE
jgi:transposase-like protein